MELVAETSAGPLELELRQVGGATVVALARTGDTWNSTYTPLSLASFLADCATLPTAEAEDVSKRVLSEWDASPESAPPRRRAQGRKMIAAFAPAFAVVVATLLVVGIIVYVVVRALVAAAIA
jgi:hypothetical protein